MAVARSPSAWFEDAVRALSRPGARVRLLTAGNGRLRGPCPPPLVPPSHHEHHELVVCVAGRAILVGAESRYELADGDAVLVEPGAWHYETYQSRQQPYDLCWLIALGGEIRYVFSHCRHGSLRIGPGGGVPAAVERELIAELERELREKPVHWQPAARATLMRLVVALTRRLQGTTAALPSETDPLARLARLIAARFREPLQIKSLAREVGLSPDHLGRRFRQRYGMTFKGYLHALRLHHARLLLQAGWSVKRTAAECGFADVYYFSRLFRQRCQVPPGRFARRGRL